jgi:hypothetical protein
MLQTLQVTRHSLGCQRNRHPVFLVVCMCLVTVAKGFVLRAHRAKPQLLFKVMMLPALFCAPIVRFSTAFQFVLPVLCKLLEEHKGEVKTAATQVLASFVGVFVIVGRCYFML